MSDSPYRTLRSKTLFENPWLKLEQHELEKKADGARFTYTYLSSAPAVMVVALTDAAEILLIRQYRYPSRRFSFELPGGGSGGLEPLEAARKELQEETGYHADKLEKIGEFITYCGLSDEICHVVFAHGLQPGPQQLEATEQISVHPTDYDELQRMIADGTFCDGMGLAALALARARILEELARRDG